MNDNGTPGPESKIGLVIEAVLFAARWLMAPFYLGLAAGLVLLLIKFAQEAVHLAIGALAMNNGDMIVGLLSLIDLSLVGNLIIMVIFTGYGGFVSPMSLHGHRDRPAWMDHVDFGDLKIKLIASIIAISAIHLLEAFMNMDKVSDRDLVWQVSLQGVFVLSGVLLALMDRIVRKE